MINILFVYSQTGHSRAGLVAYSNPLEEPTRVTSHRLLDPDEARQRLESRIGRLHARLRLGIEREHEAQAFGQGLTFLHIENMPLMQAMIEVVLRVTADTDEAGHFFQ